MTLKQLAALECRTCEETKEIIGESMLNPHGSFEFDLLPCPDCLDAKGQPTGRLLVGLTRECPGLKNPERHAQYGTPHAVCPSCHDTGRVLVSEEAAIKWLLEWWLETGRNLIIVHAQRQDMLLESGAYEEGIHGLLVRNMQRERENPNPYKTEEIQPKLLDALVAAVAAALEVQE